MTPNEPHTLWLDTRDRILPDGVPLWAFRQTESLQGWQSVFRSRTIDGPYEDRIVLEQGKSDINGPHQGAWVTTPTGEDWFIHFQDINAYGRVVLLQPMRVL